jgi:hypothetical protein
MINLKCNLGKRKLRSVPIYSISGDSEENQKQNYGRIQIQGFYSKPIKALKLIQIVNQVF